MLYWTELLKQLWRVPASHWTGLVHVRVQALRRTTLLLTLSGFLEFYSFFFWLPMSFLPSATLHEPWKQPWPQNCRFGTAQWASVASCRMDSVTKWWESDGLLFVWPTACLSIIKNVKSLQHWGFRLADSTCTLLNSYWRADLPSIMRMGCIVLRHVLVMWAKGKSCISVCHIGHAWSCTLTRLGINCVTHTHTGQLLPVCLWGFVHQRHKITMLKTRSTYTTPAATIPTISPIEGAT